MVEVMDCCSAVDDVSDDVLEEEDVVKVERIEEMMMEEAVEVASRALIEDDIRTGTDNDNKVGNEDMPREQCLHHLSQCCHRRHCTGA